MTKPLSLMAPYTVLSGGNCHHFKIESDLFLVVVGPTSMGFVIPENNIDFNRINSNIKSALGSLQINKFVEIKLIGKRAATSSLQEKLAPYGPVKLVDRIGPSEIMFYPSQNRTRVADLAKTTQDANPSEKKASIVVENKKVKVLIVDDSKTIRMLLKKVFATSDKIEVIADTGDPTEVIQLLKEKKPDVITLDIHMPKMDGLTLLKQYIVNYPIPTVMITSISIEEGPTVLNAIEAGAVDYIKKPEMEEMSEARELIIDKVLTAATSRVNLYQKTVTRSFGSSSSLLDTNSFIAIGASTGGTEALRVLLTQLPSEIPPILIVQHIPAGFSNAFARRLDSLCPFEVLEAKDNDEIRTNRVLIAPGGKQMRAVCKGNRWHVVVDDSPPVNRHKPSVDHLFSSLVNFEFHKPVGIIMTGMGGDGAKGLLALRQKGWSTIAQDKDSCVVFGMPAVAIDLGAAQHICSLNDIPSKLQQLIPKRKSA